MFAHIRANFQGTKWAMGNRSSPVGGSTFTGRDLCLGSHGNRMTWVFSKKHHKLHSYTTDRTNIHRALLKRDMIQGLCIELGSEGEAPKSVAGFSSAISACEKNGHWQIALEILTESLSSKKIGKCDRMDYFS